MRFPRKRGSTSVMVRVFIPANNVTTGAGLTGLTNASTNLVIGYCREKDATFTTYKQSAAPAKIETITTIGTYQAPTSSAYCRFKAVDATNYPGLYEIHFHNDATAFGAGDTSQNVIINIYEETTTALYIGPNAVLIPLVPWDYQDGVRMGLTALPNAAADAAGGLPISDAGGLDLDAKFTYLDASVAARPTNPLLTTDARLNNLDTTISSRAPEALGNVAAIKTQTDKLAFTVTNQVDANVLDWKSATAPAMTGDAYALLGTIRGADNDTLKTLSDQIDVAQADLDNPSQYKATGFATPTNVSDAQTAIVNAIAALHNITAADVWTLVRKGTTMALILEAAACGAAAGKTSGMEGANPIIRNLDDTANLITSTVDANQNRTTVTLHDV